MDEHHVAMHHSKGAGIEASSKAAESAAPLPPRNEPMYEWYDYVKTHEDFRRELDNLLYRLDAANKRANTAELQSQNTDRLVNQAKEVGLAKLKMQEDDFKRAYRPLKIRCDALELSIAGKDDVIDKLRRELEQERQMPAILRSEHDKTVENLEIRAVVQ